MAGDKTFCRVFGADGRANQIRVSVRIVDVVRALTAKNIPVAGVTDDIIVLGDGRALHVRFGFRYQPVPE